ncbi:hypothetical protein GAO09_03455 [Rhizobiales bacterium RZME27]|uniref:Uncharacterized protein n=1 Tax=Endobacterium cereale TaxID=2663029 RepID=A0A6A8A781_9HYPH|nr:hypothetical protein [Endobacterium cereale]MEB2844557.1 hypothetical protein [Endobacterium cereale]MQY45126.1 hypothetical protein [Endobacterium cereale]
MIRFVPRGVKPWRLQNGKTQSKIELQPIMAFCFSNKNQFRPQRWSKMVLEKKVVVPMVLPVAFH